MGVCERGDESSNVLNNGSFLEQSEYQCLKEHPTMWHNLVSKFIH